mmetsp:Transcript_44123/g.143167  ORF Transcript_44123/g.143167 Transcript_44123/m.143167 type:complete len:321 (+) Transcript_44123:311-1273(+)
MQHGRRAALAAVGRRAAAPTQQGGCETHVGEGSAAQPQLTRRRRRLELDGGVTLALHHQLSPFGRRWRHGDSAGRRGRGGQEWLNRRIDRHRPVLEPRRQARGCDRRAQLALFAKVLGPVGRDHQELELYAKAARTQRRWQEGGVLCLESLSVAEGGHECGGGPTDRRRLQRRERHPSHPALGRRAVDVQHRSGLADVSGAAGQQRTSPQFRAVSARRQPQLELWCGATPLHEGGQIARAALSRLEPPAGACSADAPAPAIGPQHADLRVLWERLRRRREPQHGRVVWVDSRQHAQPVLRRLVQPGALAGARHRISQRST